MSVIQLRLKGNLNFYAAIQDVQLKYPVSTDWLVMLKKY